MSRAEGKKSFQKDYQELLVFFPNIDVNKLEQVEEFHHRISNILNGEINENQKNLEAMISLATSKIKELEEEQLRISQLPNVAKATLERYAELQKELQELLAANEAYKKRDDRPFAIICCLSNLLIGSYFDVHSALQSGNLRLSIRSGI